MPLDNLGDPVDYHNNMTGISNGMNPIGPGLRGMSNNVDPMVLNGGSQRDPTSRHGASCLFRRDASLIPQRIEQQEGTTKRTKLNGVFGRT